MILSSTIGNISHRKIDIARIQETHNGRTGSIIINEYEIFFARSGETALNNDNATNNSGGISIAIHHSLINYIQK